MNNKKAISKALISTGKQLSAEQRDTLDEPVFVYLVVISSHFTFRHKLKF